MTAANVASTQQGIGRTGIPGVVTALALALALLAGVAIGAFAVRATTTTTHVAPAAVAPTTHQPRVGPMAASAASATRQMANYRQLVANLGAARKAHDFRSIYRIDRALDAALTPAVIGMVYQEHSRLAANLEAAYERHDMRAQALISRQVQALCGQPDVQSRLKFCN
jgi:hypothetical protein